MARDDPLSKKPRYQLQRPVDAKGRFKRMLARRFLVRLHMTLIMGAVIGAGLGTSKLLLWLGMTHMAARYGLVVVGGVLVFLGCTKLWLWYIHNALITNTTVDGEDVLNAAELALDVADLVDASQNTIPAGGDGDASEGVTSAGEAIVGLLEGEEAGIILFVIAVAAAVFLGAGIFVIWQAPIILAEAAFPAILVAALRRKGRDIDHPHWTGSVLKAVWAPVAIVLVVAVLSGFLIQAYCPKATKVSDAVERCVLKKH